MPAQSDHHTSANLAVLALASERFRLAHGRWPNSPAVLVPAYLSAEPFDPPTGGPLHYKQSGKRLIIYSVGLDGKDDGGVWERGTGYWFGKDVGFILDGPKDRVASAGSKP